MKYLKKIAVWVLAFLLVLSMLSFLIPAFLVTQVAPQNQAAQPTPTGTVTNVQTAPVTPPPSSAGFQVTSPGKY